MSANDEPEFVHIGDGVYVRYLNGQVEVRVNDPNSKTVVYLDEHVMDTLMAWYIGTINA